MGGNFRTSKFLANLQRIGENYRLSLSLQSPPPNKVKEKKKEEEENGREWEEVAGA